MKTNTTGLRQAIAQAESSSAVNDLLVIGTQYKYASTHTKRRWVNTARKRIKQLKAGAQ